MSTLNAITQSYHCLNSIYREGAYSNIALNDTLNQSSDEDKPLISKIVYGVLENDIFLNYIIKQFVPSAKPALSVLLKIGTYMITHLSIPSAVVVNDCVNHAKKIGKGAVANFVNATLRSVVRAKEANSFVFPAEPLKKASVMYSYPYWALMLLSREYGEEKAIAIASYRSDNATHVRINKSVTTNEKFEKTLQQKGLKYKKSILPDAYKIYGNVSALTKKGECVIMGLSSMLAALSVNVTDNADVLDLCAAPGGKSVYMAQLNPTAKILSCDTYPHKLRLIEKYAAKMGVTNITTELNDAMEINPAYFGKFDFVLLDVPCSGFGVCYSKPEIKLFKKLDDVRNLVAVQQKMLFAAKNYVKVGGYLTYSTCTVFAEENRKNIKNFLAQNPEFALTDLNLPIKTETKDLQILPHIFDAEGFYIARMVKTK